MIKESHEKSPNLDQYQLLEKQKRQLFEDLISSTELSKQDRNMLLTRVFEHSLEDGLDLAEQWVSDKSILIESVTRDEFIQKHLGFALRLSNRLVEYRNYVDSENKIFMDQFVDIMSEKVSDSKKQSPIKKSKKTKIAPGIHVFIDRIDDYYLNFLRLRKIKEKDPLEKNETEGEKSAEEALIADLRILEPHYYSDAIRTLVDNKVEVGHGLLDQQIVEKILKKANISLEDESVQRALKKARYKALDVIYDMQHSESERLLKKELITCLHSRGYSEDDFVVVKNENTGRYEVVDKTGGNHELSAENLRLIKEYSGNFAFTPDDPLYEKLSSYEKEYTRGFKEGDIIYKHRKLFVLDGEIYQLVSTIGNDGILIYPDGSRSEDLCAIQDVKKTKKGIYFVANVFKDDGINNFQQHLNRVRVYKNDDWGATNKEFIEREDGSTYWVSLQFNYDYQTGRYAIFRDQQLLEISNIGESIDNLRFIANKMTYLVIKNKYDDIKSQCTLVHGEEKFGPYKKIVVLENLEKLIFVATREDGSNFIYEDGIEKELQIKGVAVGVAETKNGIYVLTDEKANPDPKDYGRIRRIFNINGDKIIETDVSGLSDFGTFGGKLTYVTPDTDGDWKLFWGDESLLVKGGHRPQVVGIFGDDLVFKRQFGFGTFKVGEIRNSDLYGEDVERIDLSDLQLSKGRIVVVYYISYKEESGKGREYKVYEYTPQFTLTAQEKKKVELLNILQSNSPHQIREYFEKQYLDESKKSIKEKIKDMFEHSKSFAQNIGRMISETPALFLDTFSSKTDDLTDRNIDEFISTIFPEVQTNHRRALRKARSERHYYSSSVSSYLSGSRESNEFSDGDPRSEAKLEILTLRQPVREFISSGIYGSLKKGSSSWQKVPLQISESHIGPTREVTAEIKIGKGMNKISLPKCLNAYIIPERVKGLKEDGTEIDIEISKNSLGEVSIEVPEGVATVLYSQAIQELPVIPPEISGEQYENFRKNIERRFGTETVDSIARLPEELQIFIESIKDLDPIEKIETIEAFVRSIGYYDFDNADVQSLKRYKSTEEIIAVMAQRMKELKKLPKTPDKEKLVNKKYAGVCSDFAKLTTALLREAGIVSGMISGFQTDGIDMVVTEKNAHAISYSLFPAENGKVKIIEVDGTPNGLNEADELLLSRIRQLSLKERKKKYEEEKEKTEVDYLLRMKELEDLVTKLDDESIKKLQNGKLEEFLNIILQGVRESHFSVINRILNASRYGRYDVKKILDGNDVAGQIEFINFIEAEIKREKSKEKKEDYFKGEKLFKVIEEFTMRYSRDEGISNKDNALKIIERVLDMSKKYLDPLEYRSALAVVTYLKATKMS